ncbi:Hypothetical predicted protein [Paramuricea clavata]|uniref:Uncharacterized protein n=1 Tax=Paramuricea clavata TaxID=317549 RepID=A0A7D9D8M2_PARCT|nr:Hypothetical predicted protein [Paramuricea clavata]
MKWTFAMKLFEVIFVLWCCVVTNAQNSEPFGKNSTSFVHPSPTAVVSTMNASKTSPSSQITLVKGQTSVPHLHSSVKGARTIINSTKTVIPTTVHSTTGPMKDGGSKLTLILGCVIAAVVIVFVVGLLWDDEPSVPCDIGTVIMRDTSSRYGYIGSNVCYRNFESQAPRSALVHSLSKPKTVSHPRSPKICKSDPDLEEGFSTE